MKNVLMVNKKSRNIDPNKLIIEEVFSKPLLHEDKPHHITTIAVNYSNCFRSASLVSALSKKVNVDEEGLIYLDMYAIYYGFGTEFQSIEPEKMRYSDKCDFFLKKNSALYDNIVLNLMDADDETIRLNSSFINSLLASNLTLDFNTYVFITKAQKTKFEKTLSRVFINTDNDIMVNDYKQDYSKES